jgi:hypothetical protein
MGIKHLKRIEALLKKNKELSFSRTDTRDAIKTDYNVILEALEYLEKHKKIVKTEGTKENLFRYQWVV